MSETRQERRSQRTKNWTIAVLSLALPGAGIVTFNIGLLTACSIIGLLLALFARSLIRDTDGGLGQRVAATLGIIVNGVIAALGFLFVIVGAFSIPVPPVAQYKAVCASNMRGLGKTVMAYARDNGGKFPPSDKWCDVLLENDYAGERSFVCGGARRRDDQGPCHYAMNPNCEPNSAGDTVLLFETKGGWNQSGGPEILTSENHKGNGCNVVFNDGTVKFVGTEELNKLKW
jgi:hypothetical protein